MWSLFSDERACWLCGSPYVHRHHVYGGSRRKRSDMEGCWLYLCPAHHNMSRYGVHFDHELDLQLKQECQSRWMVRNRADVDEFIAHFGRSYL